MKVILGVITLKNYVVECGREMINIVERQLRAEVGRGYINSPFTKFLKMKLKIEKKLNLTETKLNEMIKRKEIS